MFFARPDDRFRVFLVIVDEIGDVVWYADDNVGFNTVMLENGNLLTSRFPPFAWMEYTLLGEVVSAWYAVQSEPALLPIDIPVDVFSMHNDLTVLPSGKLPGDYP